MKSLFPGGIILKDSARPTPAHYGDPLGEQRFLPTGAVVDRRDRTVLQVSGPDAGTFLTNLLSQKVDTAEEGRWLRALDLDSQGRILHLVNIVRVADDQYLVDVNHQQAQSLLDYLSRMVFWSQVTIEATPLILVEFHGVSQAEPLPTEVARRTAGNVTQVFVTQASLPEGVHPVGWMAHDAWRIQNLDPELPQDFDDKSIPHETPGFIGRTVLEDGSSDGAVHLHKGCYRGQETVARVENLGTPPRLMVRVHLDGSAPELPEPGAPITAGTRTVGRLGTVAHDADEGPIALALLKRSALAAGTLQSGDCAVAVDQDSVVVDHREQAGKRAIERLRGGAGGQF